MLCYNHPKARGFSLVEVLAAVAIIGILVFLALPNVIQAKKDSEAQLVITRAEALNMSISSFIAAKGRSKAETDWTGKDAETRFKLISGYMAYPPASLAGFQPSGYEFRFGAVSEKVEIWATANGDSQKIAY